MEKIETENERFQYWKRQPLSFKRKISTSKVKFQYLKLEVLRRKTRYFTIKGAGNFKINNMKSRVLNRQSWGLNTEASVLTTKFRDWKLEILT